MAADIEPESRCEQCGHLSDPHMLLAVYGNPLLGGIICCPEDECLCCATWDVKQAGTVFVKDVHFLALSIEALRGTTMKTEQEIAIMLASIVPPLPDQLKEEQE